MKLVKPKRIGWRARLIKSEAKTLGRMHRAEKNREKSFEELNINIFEFKEGMLKYCQRQLKKLCIDLGWRVDEFDKLFDYIEYVKPPESDSGQLDGVKWLKDGRRMQINLLQMPWLTHHNKTRYYSLFIVNIEEWELDDVPMIYNECCSYAPGTFDYQGNYTIFVIGRQRDYFNYRCIKTKKLLRRYHTVTIRTQKTFIEDIFSRIRQIVHNFFEKRLIAMQMAIKRKKHIYRNEERCTTLHGQVKKDVNRLKDFSENLRIKINKDVRIESGRWDAIITDINKHTLSSNCSNKGFNNKKREKREEREMVVVKPV